jgi:hypothetical protein
MASLVGGIIDDARHLLTQQVTLLKREVKDELSQAKRAAISAALGLWVCGMGALMLLITAALALAEYSRIPLWGCYALVGAVTTALGGVLLFLARKEASDVKLVPPPETAGALKENYQWITGRER